MITEHEKEVILQCAKEYDISALILFGSSLEKGVEANDIDIGVKGIQPQLFFKFYADLTKRLSKPVHLVDLSSKSLFSELVEETGSREYMVNLTRQIAAEKENVERTLVNLKEVMARKEKSIIELAAIATFLHNIYNGIENILKQVLKAEGIKISRRETWHKELLELSVSNGIISDRLSDKLYEYLTFGHFFVHAYGFMLEEMHLEPLANGISPVWANFLSEIEHLLRKKVGKNGMWNLSKNRSPDEGG